MTCALSKSVGAGTCILFLFVCLFDEPAHYFSLWLAPSPPSLCRFFPPARSVHFICAEQRCSQCDLTGEEKRKKDDDIAVIDAKLVDPVSP